MNESWKYDVAVIGAGKMGGAILKGLAASGDSPARRLLAIDVDTEKLGEFTALGMASSTAIPEATLAPVIVIAVKPQYVPDLLVELSGIPAGCTVISVAAGVSIAEVEGHLPQTAVIRAMPNTPAMIGRGVTVISPGTYARPDGEPALGIFRTLGKTLLLKEDYLDAVTGLSGSGPAYVALFLEALIEGGVAAGLPRDVATTLSVETVRGAAELVAQSGQNPAEIRAGVTSPGGTTAQGLRVLEAGAVRSHVIEAVCAATNRSREMRRRRLEKR